MISNLDKFKAYLGNSLHILDNESKIQEEDDEPETDLNEKEVVDNRVAKAIHTSSF